MLNVFVKLRLHNYRATLYATYDPKQDQLRATYFQAIQQQRFDVNFVRMKRESDECRVGRNESYG